MLWGAGVVGAFLTAFYMFRLYFLTFQGPSRVTEEAKHHLHESPNSMTVPLMILAVLSLVGGLVQVPLLAGGQRLDAFLEPVFADATAVVGAAGSAMGHGAAQGAAHAPQAEIILMAISLIVALSGIFVAHRFYVTEPDLPSQLAERLKGFYRLLFNKYWIDEVYDSLIVQPIYRGSVRLWERFDAAVIDGAVNGVGKQIERGAALLRQAQMGYVQVYALILTLGAVVVLGYLALR